MEPSPPDRDLTGIVDPNSEEFIEDPYSVYERLRRHARILYSPAVGAKMVIGRPEIAEILGAERQFTNRTNLDGAWPFVPECQEILDGTSFFHTAHFNMEPPEQTAFRDFVGDWFTPRRVRSLEPAVRALAESLVLDFRDGGRADMMSQFAEPFPTTIIYDLIGIPADGREQVMRWHMDWLIIQVVPLPAEEQVRCARSVVAYERYLSGLLELRAAESADDILTLFAQAVYGPDARYSVADAVVAVRVMLAAGHETTTGSLGNTVLQLLREPHLWQSLVADPARIPAAVEEGLRFDPPIQSLNRMVTEKTVVGGVEFEPGTRVCPMIGAVGRDPERVEAPHEFRLDREGSSGHMAFGAGIHTCIGAALARTELRIALETLTRLLPDLRLAPDAKIRHQPGGITFHRLVDLPVVWDTPQSATVGVQVQSV